jgi:NAD-dependent SIR2 family protein deacetylase
MRSRIICEKCGWSFLSKRNYEKHLKNGNCETWQRAEENLMPKKCPKCKSSDIIPYGETLLKRKVDLWKCSKCNYIFC